HSVPTRRSSDLLKKVPRLGAKTYEQAIGFLRIPNGKNPFDATGIHPESYKIAESVLSKVEISKEALGTEQLTEALQAVNVSTLDEELEVGQVTLQDIIDTLHKQNRDTLDVRQ